MPKEYAVAISYSGAHRTLVHTIANHLSCALARLDGAVFLDLYDRIKFIGKIDEELAAVYREKCDLAVVFRSREYFESEWCKMEWSVLKDFMLRSAPGAPRVLMFQLDRCEGESVPGYVAMDAQCMTAEQVSHVILEKMNVTHWIADAHYAGKILCAMECDRAGWQLAHRIRDVAAGSVHVGVPGDDWLPMGLAELCRGRDLVWKESGSAQLPTNIICLCGPRGAGKSTLLLRAIASAGLHETFPEQSWILDFSNNKDVCLNALQFERVPASELKRFLKRQIPRDGQQRHLFLGIDGLDSAARNLSVRTDEMTAARIAMRCLRSLATTLGELSRDAGAPTTITLVVTLNALRPAASDAAAGETAKFGTWEWMYQQLAQAGAIFADLEQLPAVDETSFRDIYDLKLNLRDGNTDSMARYIADRRDFLRLPLFLDAASWLPSADLRDATTRADFLLLAQLKGRISTWPNEIDELVSDLVRFIAAIPFGLNGDGWLRSMLRREWTGGWLQLLTEAMAGQGIAGGMQQLMQALLKDQYRWDMSASYALSNVLTALCVAGRPPRLASPVRYYNLRRATLDNVVFSPQSVLFGVDCSGSSLKQVTLEEGCRFIATDFTMCEWDPPPDQGAPTFVECRW